MSVPARLRELDITLPEAAKPAFHDVPVTVHRGVAYVGGQLPEVGDDVPVKGKVGAGVTVEQARESARVCVLRGLAYLADLERIESILQVTGFVAFVVAVRD